MMTRVQQWGNSLGVRIPKSLAREARVKKGTDVDIAVAHGRLIVAPVRSKEYVLADLVKLIKPGNLHAEVQTGTPAGREVW